MKENCMKKFVFLAFSILVSSCVSVSSAPTWVSNPTAKYSSDEYFVATGTGSSKDSAESDAKLALCQQLGEKISGEQRVTSSVDSKGRTEGTIDIDISEQAIFNHIHGVSIKETYYEKKASTYHALAVLKKRDAISYYTPRIANADMEISKLISDAENLSGDIASIAVIRNAEKLARENEYDIEILSAVRSAGRVLVSYGSVADVYQKAYEIAQKVTVNVKIEGEEAKQIQQMFVTAMKDFGLNVVSSGSAKYVLAGNSEFHKMEESNNSTYKYIRYNVVASLANAAGDIVKNFDISGREGHVTYEQARIRCLSKIKEQITF